MEKYEDNEEKSLNNLSLNIEDYESTLREVMNGIKFQVELCSYDLKWIYNVVDGFEKSINDNKDNWLYRKFQYLVDIVWDIEFFVYLKIILLNTWFSLEDILFEEIITNFPDEEKDFLDSECKESLINIVRWIFMESWLSKEEFNTIYLKAVNVKYWK